MSKFVKSIEDGSQDVDEFLKLADDSARQQLINDVDSFNYKEALEKYGKQVADVIKNRSSIAKNAGKHLAKKFEQAHHLIPIELITNEKVGKLIQKAINGGFEFNGKINAKWLKQFSSKFEHLKDGVHASHPQYTSKVVDFIENTVKTELGMSLSQVSEQEAKEILEIVAQSLDEIITANKNMKINEIVF
ncbi:AHH domain-containing protein [Chryseobacterium hagamense]|uniref:Uncharacterized protein n=1 Tax=Chryseobacterium hagamense TaxID=395935 RepID=A0A511YR87_9FLAO|nr:AHH domain-containing protein [Chryseobacterium hagamense]GEN77702.1 hypothetical protein CHA01nite_34420 [Chryseobacterium hagamense]